MNLRVFNAFQSSNYRYYFAGQSVSLVGTWMQRTAVYWLVYAETQSAAMLGAAVFANQFPSFVFSIAGGVISDRYDRFKVMLTTQVVSLLQALLLTILVYAGEYNVWHILALSVMLGITNAFDVPARQAMIYDLLSNKEHLPNAIALNSSMVHSARLVGPAIAGIVLEQFGADTCFLINALSFVAVIGSLFLMKLPPYRKQQHVNNALTDLRNGFEYLKTTPSISSIMLMLAFVSFLSLPYITLLPVYAGDIFHGSASTFGYLNSAVGLGALAGAIFLAALRPGANLRKVLFINTIIFGASLMAFSYLKDLPIALLFMALTGFGMMSQTTISNTLIQTTVAPAMRGRVLSYYAMAFFGMQPLGGLLVGFIAGRIGAPATILIEGIATVLIALVFYPLVNTTSLERKQKLKIGQLEEGSVEAS